MFKPRLITTLEDCSTYGWMVQSHGYDTVHDAKFACMKVFTVKSGAMVKPYKDKWAVFYWDRSQIKHAKD